METALELSWSMLVGEGEAKERKGRGVEDDVGVRFSQGPPYHLSSVSAFGLVDAQ